MADLVYPTNAELQAVEQDLIPPLQKNRVIFDIMPTENVDAAIVMWEQEDNYTGVQQVRGYGGKPGRVNNVGVKRWQVQPGVYGEYRMIDEFELTMRRGYGTFATPIDISDLVLKAQTQLLQREIDLQELIGWTLLTTGTYSVLNGEGVVQATDTFSLQTFTSTYSWSNLSLSTPLADFRAAKLLARGHSVDFGAGAKFYANQTTVNNLLMNNNSTDLGGKKSLFGASFLDLNMVNQVMLMNDLPQIVVMDRGYFPDTGSFTLFVPNNTGVLVGRRESGVPVATYCMTRNANNPNMGPGPYVKVVDNGENAVPREIVVHRGHNGAPKIPFPGSIVSFSC
jgi:hypothetical protein